MGPAVGQSGRIVGRWFSFFAGESIALGSNVLIPAMPSEQIIQIHALAPAKPSEGATCNGCGVCCLSQPCPLGMALSGARTGACKALRWSAKETRYLCGAVSEPGAVLRQRLPVAGALLYGLLARWLPVLARRWIAEGAGCDSSLEVSAPPGESVSDNSYPSTTASPSIHP